MVSMSSSTYDERDENELAALRERLTEVERRSLLAEQAREQAHSLRSPLSVIELISETLQLELGDDRSRTERLQRVLDAVSTLSCSLNQSVHLNRFADGPRRAVDAAKVAAEVVQAFGGCVARPDGNGRADEWRGGDGEEAAVLVNEQGFEAVLVHLLRLIGVGNSSNGHSPLAPMLSVEEDQDAQRIKLHLTCSGQAGLRIPAERADYRLMLRAVERMTRDSGGLLVLGDDRATFELPLLPAPAGGEAIYSGP